MDQNLYRIKLLPSAYIYGKALYSLVPPSECVEVIGLAKSLVFALLSLGKLSHGALVSYLGLVRKRGLKWQKRRSYKLGQNNLCDAYF